MRTVLHILNTSTYSGAENVAITIIRAMSARYTDCRLIYVSPDGPIRERLNKEGVEFEPITSVSVKEIRRVVRKYRPDMIHAHDFTASIVSAAATLRTPVISHIHNNVLWLKRLCPRSIVYGLSCIRYRKILGVSPSVFDEFVFGGLIKKKSRVIGNPIDLSVTRGAAERAKNKDGYDVVFLGRLSEAKAPLEFVEVIGELSQKMKVSAAMIGDGELRDAVSEKISALGLSDTVKLLGFMDNPHGVLGASRALCMTSKWEGYGLVAAEALALGKPVVATRVGGIPTILGEIGYLCDSKDEMINSLMALLGDAELYREASHGALERAAELDNVGEYIDGLNRIYTEE